MNPGPKPKAETQNYAKTHYSLQGLPIICGRRTSPIVPPYTTDNRTLVTCAFCQAKLETLDERNQDTVKQLTSSAKKSDAHGEPSPDRHGKGISRRHKRAVESARKEGLI